MRRSYRAIWSASQTSCAVIRSEMAHPTTRRESRSITTARHSQPSSVQRYVMSPTYFWLGPVAEKSCCNRCGATGGLCREFVVALNFFAALARRPCRRRLSAMVFRSCRYPASARSRTSLGAPERPLRASKGCLEGLIQLFPALLPG